ncbi:MAG: biopolymer transporter ExbD [Gomphosphaeria aponina SAG 52.96 = DSM 107014]|uniref:Biopolymer transporter ExbD n=1 Tax=Gomphosphaeria aponina SAG 52.96 = DSM 107014 TaxID=1521640 RepID=A0A941GW27_9CHRO|nr:biopolymer transporter ExbD [Gomphosphaeria aponina SAG 52.96 = DSM 107014]
MRITNESEEFAGEINIVPMIDVIFSILAFFIISSLFLSRTEGLPVNLPSASTAEVKDTAQINVTIEADGDIFLNRQPIKLESLKQATIAEIAKEKEGLVIINADEKVEHGQVVEVMDILRQVEGAKLAIAATKK